MKSLHQYIEESRPRIGKLPFTEDEWLDFLIASQDYDDTCDVYKKIQNIVMSQYGEKVWLGFKGWTEANSFKGDPEQLYKFLQTLPQDRIGRVLGSGSFGTVFTSGNDKVIKWFNAESDDKYEHMIYEWLLKNKHPYLPTIYKYNSKYMVMDRLDTDTPKCKLYMDITEGRGRWAKYMHPNHKDLVSLACQYVSGIRYRMKLFPGDSEEVKLVREVWEWNLELAETVNKITGKKYYPSDLRDPNVGEHPVTHNIIWFDL